MNDAFDDILADSDEEEEQDKVVNQVLDEIGIEISGKVRSYRPFAKPPSNYIYETSINLFAKWTACVHLEFVILHLL